MTARCYFPQPAEATDSIYSAADEAYGGIKGWLDSAECGALTESSLERELVPRGLELMRLLLASQLSARGSLVPAGPVVGEDGEERRHVRQGAARRLVTVFGLIVLFRRGLYGRGLDSRFPVDADLNLPAESYSLEVRRRGAVEASRGSYDEALEALKEYTGASVPKRQLEQLVVRAAQDFDAFYETRMLAVPADETSELLVLTSDGKGIAMRFDSLRPGTQAAAKRKERKLRTRLSSGEKANRKRMAQVAAVYTVAPRVRTPELVVASMSSRVRDASSRASRVRPEQKRVWASVVASADDVLHEAFLEAHTRDPDGSKRWVALVDGDPHQLKYITSHAADYGINLTIIMDLIHVLEYLWKAGHVFNKAGSTELEKWVHNRLLRVLQGKASTVAAGIRRSATMRGLDSDQRKNADLCADYLLNHKQYLRYDKYLAAGLPIATGVIEGACRHLVKDRMDITGARWGLESAEAVLRVRALRSSGDFDEYWAFHEQQEYRRNHQSRYAEGKPPTLEEPSRYRHLRVIK